VYYFLYGNLPGLFQDAVRPASGSGLLSDGKDGNGALCASCQFQDSFDYDYAD